jgi:hypothetical protein
MSYEASRCYCEEGEFCSHCQPAALFRPQGGDGVIETVGLYGRSLPECSCVLGELCRWCRPRLAQLVGSTLVELVGEPTLSEPLSLLQTPLQRLETLAHNN